MKTVRRLLMGFYGLTGWICMALLIFLANGEGKVIANFNHFGEMIIEMYIIVFLVIFFLICIILEFVDIARID